MPPTTNYKPGNVVLVPFPFTDQTATKRRPAIIVSSSPYHRHRSDLVLMAVTSQIRPSPTWGDTVVTYWEEAGLLKPSTVKPVFTTVENGLILRQLGALHEHDFQALQKTLQELLACF